MDKVTAKLVPVASLRKLFADDTTDDALKNIAAPILLAMKETIKEEFVKDILLGVIEKNIDDNAKFSQDDLSAPGIAAMSSKDTADAIDTVLPDVGRLFGIDDAVAISLPYYGSRVSDRNFRKSADYSPNGD